MRIQNQTHLPIRTIGAALMGLGALSAVFVLWQKIALSVWVHRNFDRRCHVYGLRRQFLALGLIAEIVIRTYFETHQNQPIRFLSDLDPRTKGRNCAPAAS